MLSSLMECLYAPVIFLDRFLEVHSPKSGINYVASQGIYDEYINSRLSKKYPKS
jgi:hypothetical protein